MGFDKTTVSVGGVPCAERAARLLGRVLHPVIEVGPGCTSLPAVREDPAGAGPLAAISAGRAELRRRNTNTGALVIAGDLPLLSEAAVEMLAGWPTEGSVVPVVGGLPQPLCARWSAAALDQARRLVAEGERSMRVLLVRSDVALIEEAAWPVGVETAAFSDVDTPEDLERLGLAR